MKIILLDIFWLYLAKSINKFATCRVAKSDDPRDPGSCKFFGSCVKFSIHEMVFSCAIIFHFRHPFLGKFCKISCVNFEWTFQDRVTFHAFCNSGHMSHFLLLLGVFFDNIDYFCMTGDVISLLLLYKKFTSISMRDTHSRTHIGEKPFHCSQCPKTFSQGQNLNACLRTHKWKTISLQSVS